MTPSRLVLVLLPLLALLGLPIIRQIEVCCAPDEHGSSGHAVAVMHWAGACPCEASSPAADVAIEPASADGVACDCEDAPLAEDDQVTLLVNQPTPLPPIALAQTIFDLAFISQPRPTAKAPRYARPPPLRAAALTHLASVRLLI